MCGEVISTAANSPVHVRFYIATPWRCVRVVNCRRDAAASLQQLKRAHTRVTCRNACYKLAMLAQHTHAYTIPPTGVDADAIGASQFRQHLNNRLGKCLYDDTAMNASPPTRAHESQDYNTTIEYSISTIENMSCNAYNYVTLFYYLDRSRFV